MKAVESKRNCSYCIMKKCFINKYCSKEWRSFFNKNKTTFKVKAGERIFTKGEPIKGVYTVYSGFIKVFDFDDKTERIVDLITNENILGYRGLAKKATLYSVSAEALSDCEITLFSIETLRLAVESNRELAFFIIDMLINKLRRAEIRNKNFQKLTAKEKIICSLNEIINVFGFKEENTTCLKFTPKRKDIAALAGTTYETVVRVLSKLDKQQYIKIEGKKILILDKVFFKKNTLDIF